MEDLNVGMFIFLVCAGFVSAFVDSVVGGGGLISIPALLLTGLPPQVVLGTNKLASVMGSMTSSVSFLKSGKMDTGLIKYLLPISLIGSILGAGTVRLIPSSFLRPMVVVMLIGVAIYTFFKKDWGEEKKIEELSRKNLIISIVVAFSFGFYDGFFGPGTGSFLIFAFLMLGFDFVTAAGNAKALNFASNLGAILTFWLAGVVDIRYGLIMGISMILGALTGSRLAISKGTVFVRPMFITITIILIGKQVWDLCQ